MRWRRSGKSKKWEVNVLVGHQIKIENDSHICIICLFGTQMFNISIRFSFRLSVLHSNQFCNGFENIEISLMAFDLHRHWIYEIEAEVYFVKVRSCNCRIGKIGKKCCLTTVKYQKLYLLLTSPSIKLTSTFYGLMLRKWRMNSVTVVLICRKVSMTI